MSGYDTKALRGIPSIKTWISTTAMSYRWHEFLALMWPILVPSWFVGGLIAFLLADDLPSGSSVAGLLFWSAILLPVIALTIAQRSSVKSCKEQFKKFLADNNLSSFEDDGFIINSRDGQTASFCRIQKAVGDRGRIYCSAVIVEIDESVPEIVLDARQNNRWVSSLPTFYDESQHLSLEGDFNDYFSLYGPVKWRNEVLSIITPDVMQVLIESGHKLDLEIVSGPKSKLIISTPGYIGYKPGRLTALCDAYTAIMSEINHKLKTLNIKPDDYESLKLKKHEAIYTISILGKRVRMFRAIGYVWLFIGLLITAGYLIKGKEYYEDIGILYLGASLLLIYARHALKDS